MMTANTTENIRPVARAPVLDFEQLLARCMGSLDLADRCLTRFAQKLPADVECVQQCVDADNRSELGQVAHRIKGSAATISAIALAQAAAELERLSRGEEDADLTSVLETFFREVERFLESIPQLGRLHQAPVGGN